MLSKRFFSGESYQKSFSFVVKRITNSRAEREQKFYENDVEEWFRVTRFQFVRKYIFYCS